MFEFCISCGEGTLLDYGMGEEYDLGEVMEVMAYEDVLNNALFYDAENVATVVIGPASPECQTGK